MYHLL
jgi:ABC-type methionine transport system permease subunit